MKDAVEAKHQQKIKSLKEHYEDKLSTMKAACAKQVKSLKEQYEDKVSTLRASLAKAESDVKWEQKTRIHLEGEVWELRERCARKGKATVLPF